MKRSSKKAIIITGILLALPALFLVEEHFRGKHALAKLKRELIAKGEKFTIDECRVPLPDGADNAYPELLRAIALFPGGRASQVAPSSMRAVAPGKVQSVFSLNEWASPYAGSPNPPRTNTWETLTNALAPEAEQLPAFRALLRKPLFVPTTDYRQGFTLPLPHLAKMKSMAQELSADALLQLHQGNHDVAVDDILSMLLLSHAMRDDRLMICQMVRSAIAALAIGPTWQVIQAPGVTDAQLARLQSTWQAEEFLADATLALEMERAMAIAQYDRFRSAPSAFADAVDSWNNWGGLAAGAPTASSPSFDDVLQQIGEKGSAAVTRGIFVPLWQFAWSYEDERFYVATLQQTIDGARASQRAQSMQAASRTAEAVEQSLNGQNPYGKLRRTLSNLMLPSLDSYLTRTATIEVQGRIAVTAIAIHRHQVRHGKPPRELGDLVPEFLPAVPRDLFDGQPLRYRLGEGGGFLLYSIGKDGKDDGGDPKPHSGKNFTWNQGRDLVWPQPASAEEIEAVDKKANGATRAAPSPAK